MKVMIRKKNDGKFSVYVPKKDLEETITKIDGATIWGSTVTLANGWRLALPALPEDTVLPLTVEAQKIGD